MALPLPALPRLHLLHHQVRLTVRGNRHNTIVAVSSPIGESEAEETAAPLVEPVTDSQFPSTQDLFGAHSSSRL